MVMMMMKVVSVENIDIGWWWPIGDGDTLKNRDDTKHLEKESEFHEREIKSQFVYDNFTLLMMMIQEHWWSIIHFDRPVDKGGILLTTFHV